MTETEVPPSIDEINRYNVVDRVARLMKLCWLGLNQFLELFYQAFVFFAFLDGNFQVWPAVRSCACFKLNVHVDKFIRKQLRKEFKVIIRNQYMRKINQLLSYGFISFQPPYYGKPSFFYKSMQKTNKLKDLISLNNTVWTIIMKGAYALL